MKHIVKIEKLGASGDGIGYYRGKKIFVSGTLPGEKIEIELDVETAHGYHSKIISRLNSSNERQDPECMHFDLCGGCVAQHYNGALYKEWKLNILRNALLSRGIKDVEIAPLISSPPASRRRTRLSLSRSGRTNEVRILLGFNQFRTSKVINIISCNILLPRLQNLLSPLRTLVKSLSPSLKYISITQADVGLELIFHGLHTSPNMQEREIIADFAHSYSIARIAVEVYQIWERKKHLTNKNRITKSRTLPETIVQPSEVKAIFSNIAVPISCGAFLQPTKDGEEAIVRQLVQGLRISRDKPLQIADLYSGIGSIGLNLAARAQKVTMYEYNKEMAHASALAGNLAKVKTTTNVRNLSKQPLRKDELNKFDAVIFDPPRAGARSQATHLAQSKVERIAAVSCNPATFSRDARILINGGYKLLSITPIDQFKWSHHIELVGLFELC